MAKKREEKETDEETVVGVEAYAGGGREVLYASAFAVGEKAMT